MKILLYAGIGLVLLAFFVGHFQHGWYVAATHVTTGPSGKPMTTTAIRLWGPADLGSAMITLYLVLTGARWLVRRLRERRTER